MKVNIKTTNIDLTDSISDYVYKKLGSLDKFFDPNDDVLINVEVGKTTKHHKSGDIFKAEISLSFKGNDYYANAETEDLYSSIDKVKDDILREFTSKKKKTIRLLRRGGMKVKNILRGMVDIKNKSWNRLKNFRYKK